ncbi:DUF2306 domain-containing protein [Agromyces sp. MMS24-JH15]|uniref:DUF2306 domain-containing protein n=1 Tax=Agromyces sp. MMS24-JH15 TaxID=3243765 RepID=UPI00374A924A
MTTAPARRATSLPGPTPTPAPAPARGAVGRRIGWTWLALSSLAIAVYSVSPYLMSSLQALSEQGVGLARTYEHAPAFAQAAFYAHIVAGGIALVVSPFQFWAGLRNRFPKVHRWMGAVALLAIGVAGVCALVIAPFSKAGLAGLVGFGAMGLCWLASGWLALRAIRRRDIRSHRAWMMRAFALTYGAVTLRLWIGLLVFAQVPFAEGGFDFDAAFANAYGLVPFLCWIPNLLIAEWLIARRGLPGFRLVDPRA